MLRLDLHQRFILHIHFALTFAAARSMSLRRGRGELRNGAQLDRVGFDLNQVAGRGLRCRSRCRNHGSSRCWNHDLGWRHDRRQGGSITAGRLAVDIVGIAMYSLGLTNPSG